MHSILLPIATDGIAWLVCLSVCLLIKFVVSCAKTAEMSEMKSGRLTHVDPRNRVLDGVQIPPPHKKGHF